MHKPLSVVATAFFITATVHAQTSPSNGVPDAPPPVRPRVVTEPTRHDTDDPAIWINRANPEESLVIGTDKNVDGALYVFGLDGKIHRDKVVRGILRPNNVDIAYDVMVGGRKVDIAVVTERLAHRLRVYRLPDMAPIDGGGIPVFEREQARDCMGVALYTRASDGALFAIVSRSEFQSPRDGYLHQYRLIDDGTGMVQGVFSRAFGTWSGTGEVEAIAVDNEHGCIYYSDEGFGIRKYLADPSAEDAEDQVAEFGLNEFTEDREGISIYKVSDGTGYILISDQQANQFRIYRREGEPGNPHDHSLVKTIRVSTNESDGSDVTNVSLGSEFPRGLFVAMSDDRTFQFYAWEDVAGNDLTIAPGGIPTAK